MQLAAFQATRSIVPHQRTELLPLTSDCFLTLCRPGIVETWPLSCCWPQPTQQETHGTYEDHTFTGIGTLLIVLAITSITAQPGKGPLHHPTDGERLESFRILGRLLISIRHCC